MIHGDTSLDTSVLLRLLVGVPEDQSLAAQNFLEGQLNAENRVFVNELVLAEAYFALQAFYQLTRHDALEALRLFTLHSGVTVSPKIAAILAQPNLAAAKPGFVDRMIHGICEANEQTLVTFEKAAKKLSSTHLLAAVGGKFA